MVELIITILASILQIISGIILISIEKKNVLYRIKKVSIFQKYPYPILYAVLVIYIIIAKLFQLNRICVFIWIAFTIIINIATILEREERRIKLICSVIVALVIIYSLGWIVYPAFSSGTLSLEGGREMRVFLDEKGVKSNELSGLSTGEHKLTLIRNGFETIEDKIKIKRGEKLIYTPRWKLAIEITSQPPSADIYLDGERLEEQTPLSWKVSAGEEHSVKLVKEGYKDWEFSFLSDGKIREIKAILEREISPSRGLLSLLVMNELGEVLGDSQIKITSLEISDEIEEASTDAEGKHSTILEEGRYQLSIIKEGYKDWKDDIEIREEEEQKVVATLAGIGEDKWRDNYNLGEEHFKRAVEGFNAREYEIAIKGYQEAIEEYQRALEIIEGMKTASSQLQERELKRALADTCNNLASIYYYQKDDIDEAQSWYEKMTGYADELEVQIYAKAYVNLGDIYCEKGEIEKANKIFEEARKLDDTIPYKYCE